MAVEIELKARLEDPEPVKQRLAALGSRARSYLKSDTYWVSIEKNIPPSGIRVRRETSRAADGDSESVIITYKTKELRDGIEINDEQEFTVSDAEVFEELLGRMGLTPGIKKEKQGWAWTLRDGTLAELSLVKGLGWFIELEILAEDRDEQTLAESRARLLSCLAELGIPPAQIEDRPYSQMLSSAPKEGGPVFHQQFSVYKTPKEKRTP